MIRVLLIGDTSWPEFRPCIRLLAAADGVRLRRRASIVAAADAPSEHDLVLILQRYPGEHRAGDLDRLRRRLPLARYVVILGSWCEGEVRSGEPLPGVLRYYWHQWLSSAEEQLRLLRAGKNRAWSLPPTATDEDLVLAEVQTVTAARGRQAEKPDAGKDAPLLLVVSRDYAVFEWLRAAAGLWGITVRWHRCGAGLQPLPARTAGVVIDVERDGELPPRHLGRFQPENGGEAPPPIVLLMGFPRWHDVNRYLRAGATAVLSKPCALRDLERILVPQLRDDAA
ncbi:MAG: hypothetical protein GYA33_09645 [Thermogutta sp.]|nr:hypothetical protein [Thermogutta sp.]